MEESAQRRERLKAMRMEASQAATHNDTEHSTVSHGLSNPLLEISAINQGQMESCATQRFDYYTDPVSAFSGNKRRSKVSPQISQDYSTPPIGTWNPETIPSPALQPHINYSLDPRMHQAQGHYRNVIGMPSPASGSAYNSPRGGNFSSPGIVHGSSPSFNSREGRGCWFNNGPRPGFVQEGSPRFNSGQSRGPWISNSPGPGSGRGAYPGSPGFGQEGSPRFNSGPGGGPRISNSPGPSSGRGGYPASPGFGQEGSPRFNSGQGKTPWISPAPSSGHGDHLGSPGFGQGSSISPNPGQGRGRWFGNNTSPGPKSGIGRGRWSGQSGGRGRGSHNHVSAEDRPDIYYNKSMVEDPWKLLKPVIWQTVKGLNTPGSLKSWLPNSISMKKAKVSETPKQSSSQPSLAEYLAASFNEAANEEPGV